MNPGQGDPKLLRNTAYELARQLQVSDVLVDDNQLYLTVQRIKNDLERALSHYKFGSPEDRP